MFKFVVAAVAALAVSVPAVAQEVQRPLTIVVQANGSACGGGRVAQYWLDKAMDRAKVLATDARAQGREVKIVRANEGEFLRKAQGVEVRHFTC